MEVFIHKDMWMTYVFKRCENSQIQSQGSYNGSFTLLRRGVMGSVCRLILTRGGSLLSREEGNSQGSLNLVYMGQPCIAPRQSNIWGSSSIHG